VHARRTIPHRHFCERALRLVSRLRRDTSLESRCAGVVALDRSFGSLEDARETNWPALVDLANEAIAERDADVAILTGAPLAGLATRARDLICVPVVDPVAAAVKQAEALIALRTIKATLSSFRRPAPKATTGLSPKLTAYWEATP